jgi:type IV secretion system protein VirB1
LDRVTATAHVESGLQTTALHDNTSGQSYQPASETEAVALATALHLQGHSLDAGIMQVNDSNWARLGLTAETAFDPRANICAGMMVLAEAYSVERRVSCRYNTGRPDCANGYPERIEGALRRVRALMPIGPGETQPQALLAAEPAPAVDPFVRHAPAREMTFAPSFRPAAQLQDGPRPAAPAVPASLVAAPTPNAGELVSIRSSNR